MRKIKWLLAAFIALHLSVKADVKPNSLFSDNVVLQRGVEVPVWGTAADGEKITVSFAGQKLSTVAKGGNWFVKLKALKASSVPQKMTIQGDNLVEITNIVVGEVWVCSGQSNMEMLLSSAWPAPITNWKEEASKANYPLIRQFFVAKKASDTSVKDANSSWVVCDTVTVKKFTAVGYFFARDLYKQLQIPIGLLFSSWGGTSAERWTPREILSADTALVKIVETYHQAMKEYPDKLAKYKAEESTIFVKWAADTLAASKENKTKPKKPSAPGNPIGGAGGLYNAMINPLIPYAIKGVIWYQGEADRDKAKQYQHLFPTMINAWRKNWNQGDFPFLFVMMAPFSSMRPEIREAQLFTLSTVKNTAMASTIDCGERTNIHPPYKQPVGARLALAARAVAYNEKIEYSGPLYTDYKSIDNTIRISFSHVGKGLDVKGDSIIGFTIAGENKKFLPAKAVVKGDNIILSNPQIAKPVAAGYGWETVPNVNLYNKDGLPAVPFRTDVEDSVK